MVIHDYHLRKICFGFKFYDNLKEIIGSVNEIVYMVALSMKVNRLTWVKLVVEITFIFQHKTLSDSGIFTTY